jgi:acetolactate synthase-1/2/3 large subunit
VTGIADAFMDSIPLVAITGQVPQAMIGKGGFQETDFFGMTLPIVKHSYLVTDVNDIPRIVKEAFYIAQSGRPGPVVIDVPKNIQQTKTQPIFPNEIQLRGYEADCRASEIALNEIIGQIEKAERPILYCGGGIISANAAEDHGLRRISRGSSALFALAGDARHRLRQLGRQRRVREDQRCRQQDRTRR